MATQLVKLNVGGVQYATSMSTIAQYPGSMLTVMMEQENERQLIASGQEIFIDRNGHVFKHVLEFLRNGNCLVLPDDKKTQRELALEAEFSQLDGLKRLVDEDRTKYIVGDIVWWRYGTDVSTKNQIYSQFNRFDFLGSIIGRIVDITARGDLVVEFGAKVGPKESKHPSIDQYRDLSLKFIIPVQDLLPKVV